MDYEDFVKAFREEEKKEMSKTKSIVRVKTKHSDKIRSEKYRQEFKKNILNTLTHDMHRYKRVAASLDDKTSTRFRKAVSKFRQEVSEL
jgi:DNA-binding transcriptional regulator GbsR (MarR family)